MPVRATRSKGRLKACWYTAKTRLITASSDSEQAFEARSWRHDRDFHRQETVGA